MKNTRILLLILGLLLLSGNASAIMISGTVGNEYKKMDLTMEEISSLISNYRAETKKDAKHLKKANKKFNKLNKFVSKMAGMSEAKAARKAGKLSNKQRKLASILNTMNLGLSAYVAGEAQGTDGQTQPDHYTVGADSGSTGEARGIPEPSTIALLGIGLAGFAAARRFKQQS